MGLIETITNALGGQKNNKTSNSFWGNDFLRGVRHSQDSLVADWSDVHMSDEDMYKGYTYAVIQKRGNKVASLAKSNLNTWANSETVEAFNKKGVDLIHPYLKKIEDSSKFTEKQFYKNISIYLDLAGVYYLGAIRAKKDSLNGVFPTIYGDVKEFVMLNPYEIRRVVNKDGEVAGYIERKKDGRYREWPKHMIIEMKELNPFDPEKSQWAMTDAVKEVVYAINKAGDFTRKGLARNIEAPGIVTTDVILDDTDFANFRARVLDHRQGEPLFGNGAGSIKWVSMENDLNKAALLDVNEINRTALFAVSGTSKTALGIEQSGTTRDTAQVQREQLMSDTIQPRLEDIVDFLNLDYRKCYADTYKKTGLTIEVLSAVGRDYSVETSATGMREAQFNLFKAIADAGYTDDSAQQYAVGEIELSDLRIDEVKKKEMEEQAKAQEQAMLGDSGDNGDDNSDDSSSGGGSPDKPLDDNGDGQLEEQSEEDVNEAEKVENSSIVEHEHGEDCNHEAPKIDTYNNDLSSVDIDTLNDSYDAFLERVKEIQREALKYSESKLEINAFSEEDIVTKRKKESLIEKLRNSLKQYWWILVPLFGENAVNQRNNEFKENYNFKFTNEFKSLVDENAQKVAEGHINTIFGDVLEASNRAYTRLVENIAGELLIKAYKENQEKFKDFFDHIPTIDEAIRIIRKTDILERNRRIYERANKLAREGQDRKSIIKAVREEYKEVSGKRATLIARNETSRAFTKSQYEADYQFLNSIGKLKNAYKELYSRSGDPCKYCQALINKGPIPFVNNFLTKGETLTVNENGNISSFTANYESIEGGTVHPNCNCSYRLVIKDEKVENKANPLDGGFNLANWVGSKAYDLEKMENTTITIEDGEKKVVVDLDAVGGNESESKAVLGQDMEDESIEELEPVNEDSERNGEVFSIDYEDVDESYFNLTFVNDEYKAVLNGEKEESVQKYMVDIENGKEVFPVLCREVEGGRLIVDDGIDRLRAFYLLRKKPNIMTFGSVQDALEYVKKADEYGL